MSKTAAAAYFAIVLLLLLDKEPSLAENEADGHYSFCSQFIRGIRVIRGQELQTAKRVANLQTRA